ncbi:hypothetical protein PG990_007294 [Apiospora arundinis]
MIQAAYGSYSDAYSDPSSSSARSFESLRPQNPWLRSLDLEIQNLDRIGYTGVSVRTTIPNHCLELSVARLSNHMEYN